MRVREIDCLRVWVMCGSKGKDWERGGESVEVRECVREKEDVFHFFVYFFIFIE